MKGREIIMTSDGSHTILNNDLHEHYHSIHGAVSESDYVFIRQGLDKITNSSIAIFEMGFGTGLNALLTLLAASGREILIHYTTLELYPVSKEEASCLNYPEHQISTCKSSFTRIHQAEWGKEVEITPYFHLRKIKADMRKYVFDKKYDLVYYDAFSPKKQPELWSKEMFEKISRAMSANAILVTYSSSSLVRRALSDAGLTPERIRGPLNKRHMLRAVKIS